MEQRALLAKLLAENAEATKIIQVLRQLIQLPPPDGLSVRWHPVGFVDIPIFNASVTERGKISHSTVHVWHPSFGNPQRPPHVCHSHGWHLTSRVLYGDFVNETYDVMDDPMADFMLYEVTYGQGTSISTATGRRVRARVSGREAIGHGALYEVPSDTFHQTRTGGNDLVITAMISSGFTGARPLNVRLASSGRTHTYQRTECPDDIRTSVLQDILSRFP